MERKKLISLFLAVVVLEALIFITKDMFLSFREKRIIEEKLKKLYELANPGTTIEVSSIKEENGMYKVLIKSTGIGGTNYAEVYVSKDGELLGTNMIRVEESIQQMERLKNFVDCLDERGVRIYGITNATASPTGAAATSLQLQALGVYSTKLFVSCDGPFVQRCIDLNITQVPAIVIGDKVYIGVKTIPWLEQTTGCNF
jgi:hypothetical protein